MKTKTWLQRDQVGVSLLEVLIALVILTLGILSVVALQLVSKRNNSDGAQEAMAAQQAYDIIERMRTNASPTALLIFLTESPHLQPPAATAPNPNCAAPASQCTPRELARHDLWHWFRQLASGNEQIVDGAAISLTGGLASPQGCIEGPVGGANGTYTVTIAWRGAMSLPNDATVACGSALTDAAGGRVYGSNDEYRRTLSINAYIANN
jgi:type IV pilus assembly protein PilV